jgi:hypothetical protein
MAATTHVSVKDLLDQLAQKQQKQVQDQKHLKEGVGIDFILMEVEDSDVEFNFVFRAHDGALVLTRERYTLDAFEKVARELSLQDYEPVQFTGG